MSESRAWHGPTRTRALVPASALEPYLVAALGAAAICASIGLAVGGTKPVLAFLVGMSPTPLGVWLVWRAHGRRGIEQLGRRILRWRFSAAYYAIALLMAPAILIGSQAIAVALGVEGDERWLVSPTAALSLHVLFLVPVVVLTEIGWRGVALPAAMAQLGSVVGALVIGLAQGVWSLGLILLGTSLPVLGPFEVLWTALTWSFIWAFLTHRTRGSLLATILFHLSLLYWTRVTPDDKAAAAISLVLYALAAALAAWGLPPPRRRSRTPPPTRDEERGVHEAAPVGTSPPVA